MKIEDLERLENYVGLLDVVADFKWQRRYELTDDEVNELMTLAYELLNEPLSVLKGLQVRKTAKVIRDDSDPEEPRRYCSNCHNGLDYYGDFGEWVGGENNYCSECGAKFEVEK